ncbi:MAG: hypothetical protein ABSE49_30445, partial [Polyangiaceae bacterium]
MSLRRWLPYGAIALAAHLAVLEALRAPARGTVAPPRVDVSAVELDVEAAPPTPVEVPPPLPPAASEPATAARVAGARTAATATATATATESAPATATGAASDGWTFDPRKPADVLAPSAIAEAVRDAQPVAEAPPAPPTGVSKTGGLAEGLDAHDAAIGLGHGGPVVSALELAAASSAGAPDGKATFEFAIDASGRVSVALLSASGASAEWSKVGAAAVASLDPKRMRIPPGASGWHVVATVEAKVQYPNGQDPKKLGTHVEGTPDIALEENKHRANVEDPPIVFKKTPHVTLAHAGKVCSVAITLGLSFGPPITGGCDPTNIGAHTTRV